MRAVYSGVILAIVACVLVPMSFAFQDFAYSEPVGFSQLFYVDGSSSDPGMIDPSGDGWFSGAWSDPGRVVVVDDPNAIDGKALQKNRFVGDGDGFAGVMTLNWVDEVGYVDQLYIRARMQFSPNWQQHPSGTSKLFYYGGGAGGNANEFYPQMNGNSNFRWRDQSGSGSDGVFQANNFNAAFTTGEYHTIEILHIAQSAPNTADGSVRVWFDGQEITDWNWLGNTNSPSLNARDWFGPEDPFGLKGLQWGVYWGGSGGTKTVNDWVRWDEFYVSGSIQNNSSVCSDGAVQSCGTDVGVCSFGSQFCSGGVWSACVGGVSPTPSDACNDGLDNDCDGQVDEGCWAGLPGDFNLDSVIDFRDLVNVLSKLGRNNMQGDAADVDNDGDVDLFDLVLVARDWQRPAPPSLATMQVPGELRNQINVSCPVEAGRCQVQRVQPLPAVSIYDGDPLVATVYDDAVNPGMTYTYQARYWDADWGAESLKTEASATVSEISNGAPQPIVFEDFSTYSSMPNFISDPRNMYSSSDDINTGDMVLDSSVSYGASSQSLRYNYPAGTATDYTISRSLTLPPITEAWTEVVVRWSTDFTISGNGQGAGQGQKFLHHKTWDGVTGGRFAVDLVDGTVRAYGPNDDFGNLYLFGSTTTGELFDGNWHVIRHHIKLGAQDFHELWVDGVYQGNATGSTSVPTVYGLSLARNLNMLADRDMELWWGQIKVWDQNPGWGSTAACTCNDLVCQSGNTGLVCDSCNYVAAPQEICDLVDNDCDGQIDEGNVCNSPQPIPLIELSFDEGSGSIAVDSQGNYDGSITGATYASGYYGSALDFDGSDFVNLGNVQLTTDLTLSAWIQPQGVFNPGSAWIIANKGNSQFDWRLFSDGTMAADLAGVNLADSYDYSSLQNQWVHVAVVFDSQKDTVSFYRNGLLSSSTSNSNSLSDSGYALWVGRHSQFNFGSFDGLIDNFRLYDAALTSQELAVDMNTPIIFSCECSSNACELGNTGRVCNGCSYVSAPTETCNSVDDDCDGQVDEGCQASSAWLEEDFSSYSDTQDLINSNAFVSSEDINENQIGLSNDGLNAFGINLPNSMRYLFPDRTAEGGSGGSGRCGSYTVSRAINFPTDVREVWTESFVKFDNNFITVAPANWGCTSNPDLKLQFVGFRGAGNGIISSGRYQIKAGTFGSTWDMSGPSDSNTAGSCRTSAISAFNGQWHRLRTHIKLPTVSDSNKDVNDGTADGVYEVWINDQKVCDLTSIQTSANSLYSIKLGANNNQGPGQVQGYNWGLVRAYNQDPGWESQTTGNWLANMPSNYAMLTEIDFSQDVPPVNPSNPQWSASIVGTDWEVPFSEVAGLSKQLDNSAPTSNKDVWQVSMPAGTYGNPSTGTDFGGLAVNIGSLSQRFEQDLYVAVAIKWDNNFEWHPISNKWFELTSPSLVLLGQSNEGGRWIEGANLQTGWRPGNNVDASPISEGDWHIIEFLVERSTGSMKIWMDNDLRFDYSGQTADLPLEATNAWQEFYFRNFRGGGGETKTRDSWIWYDHIFVAVPN